MEVLAPLHAGDQSAMASKKSVILDLLRHLSYIKDCTNLSFLYHPGRSLIAVICTCGNDVIYWLFPGFLAVRPSIIVRCSSVWNSM